MKRFSTAVVTIAGALVFSAAAMAQNLPGYTPGVNSNFANSNSSELANFNSYLDGHPNVAKRLETNPRLVDDPQFVSNHPGLQNFLKNHPGVSNQLRENPGQFVNREGHYEWSHGGGPVAEGPGFGNGAVGRFDRGYLDEHPDVSRQLAENPHLADSPQFLASHPGLGDYLKAHPEVRTDLEHHPYRFMSREDRHDQWDRGDRGDRDGAHPLAHTDQYLDQHPKTAAQLEEHPGLVDDPRYVEDHPELHNFMETHPVARNEWKSHPDKFMNREKKYDTSH